MLMLIGPDRRDRAFWLDNGQMGKSGFLGSLFKWLTPLAFIRPEVRHFMRIAWRLLTLIVLLSASMALVSAYPLVTFVIGLVAVVVLGTRLNLADHVITAAARDAEREALLDYLEDRLRWLERRCDKLVVIAHSQGGYLAHQLLARDGGRNQAKVVRFVGVGSGLKPISVLRWTRRPAVFTVSWLLPFASLSLSWGTLPLLSDTSVAASAMAATSAATMLTALPVAATGPGPAAEHLRSAVEALRPHTLADYLPFGNVTGMDSLHWLAISVSAVITAVCALLIRRFIWPMERQSLALPQGFPDKKFDWQEHSSQHDMVGRMLLPSLPGKVEQEATPVLGHPLRDHTMYFAPDGMLVRQLAGELLSDLETSSKKSFGADRWRAEVARHTRALRKQHDRRRMFHGLLTLTVVAAVLSPRLALGASLPAAVAHAWLPLGLTAIFLSYIFTGRGRTSLRKAVTALDTELRGGVAQGPLLNVVPPGCRTVPVAVLALAAVLAVYGALWLTKMQELMPSWQVTHPGSGLVTGVVLAILAAAIASGYRVKRRWAVGAAALVTIPPLTSHVPHPANVPAWAAAPGLLSAAVIAVLVGVAVVALTRMDPVSLPARDTPDTVPALGRPKSDPKRP
ncbi:hypothetical protein [Streptomyces sp. NPDC001404]|uniref:hypothetical protein n=1 Tax=Streptomyces sp. NPDC001404 TaxID=3364571 RepID=UPI003694CC42